MSKGPVTTNTKKDKEDELRNLIFKFVHVSIITKITEGQRISLAQDNTFQNRQFFFILVLIPYIHMTTLISILPTLQVILSVLLVTLVLLQRSEESLGGAFGGSDSVDTTKNTRRGSEKTLFQSAIVVAVLFVLVSIFVVITK